MGGEEEGWECGRGRHSMMWVCGRGGHICVDVEVEDRGVEEG